MELSLIGNIVLGAAVLGCIVYIVATIRAGKQGTSTQDMEAMQGAQAATADLTRIVLQEMNEMRRTLDSKIGESSNTMRESFRMQFGESQRLIQDVTRELTSMKETGRHVASVAEELKSLQSMLKNPKQRGVIGEFYLEALLQNVLPPGSYQMQYRFSPEDIVDAAIFVGSHIIPVDAKFSLENYQKSLEEGITDEERGRREKLFVQDLKNRIVETSKYIQPSKQTLDFAFMFIPHEAIYYDLLVNRVGALKDEDENLIQRAASKYKVIIVSPTSFLAYLQTVLQGLKALKIEESAKKIAIHVNDLARHLKSYEDYHGKLGAVLGTAVNHYNATVKEFKKIDKDVVKITAAEYALGASTEQLEKPDVAE